MPKFVHDFDLMCSIRSDSDDPDDVTLAAILDALEKRIVEIRAKPLSWRDSIGHVSTERVQ